MIFIIFQNSLLNRYKTRYSNLRTSVKAVLYECVQYKQIVNYRSYNILVDSRFIDFYIILYGLIFKLIIQIFCKFWKDIIINTKLIIHILIYLLYFKL